VDGVLYKIIRADRAQDIIRAWCFETKKIVQFVYSDVKRNSQQAFDTEEVAKLLNRSKTNLFYHLRRGTINPPYKIHTHDHENHQYDFGYFKWSEDDVFALHEHYLTAGAGRPRKDGILRSAPRIPSRLELVAMMKHNKMYYVQDADGNFVPIFNQPDWT
jgi:hypothetical protein